MLVIINTFLGQFCSWVTFWYSSR